MKGKSKFHRPPADSLSFERALDKLFTSQITLLEEKNGTAADTGW
jgi:hypothetical protein